MKTRSYFILYRKCYQEERTSSAALMLSAIETKMLSNVKFAVLVDTDRMNVLAAKVEKGILDKDTDDGERLSSSPSVLSEQET